MCLRRGPLIYLVFFFNDTATTEIYTLSLHDALPIFGDVLHAESGEVVHGRTEPDRLGDRRRAGLELVRRRRVGGRSEEHTSELQSRLPLVCRLLLGKKT